MIYSQISVGAGGEGQEEAGRGGAGGDIKICIDFAYFLIIYCAGTVQREKSSQAYKLSSNVQTACSKDSLNNCPKHSILRFSSFALKIYL